MGYDFIIYLMLGAAQVRAISSREARAIIDRINLVGIKIYILGLFVEA